MATATATATLYFDLEAAQSAGEWAAPHVTIAHSNRGEWLNASVTYYDNTEVVIEVDGAAEDVEFLLGLGNYEIDRWFYRSPLEGWLATERIGVTIEDLLASLQDLLAEIPARRQAADATIEEVAA